MHNSVQVGRNFVFMLPQRVPNWIFEEVLALHWRLRHQSRVTDDTTIGCPADCLLVIREVDRIVAPEILLRIHSLNNIVHCLEHVISEGPHAHCTLLGAKCQVPSISREVHLSDVKD